MDVKISVQFKKNINTTIQSILIGLYYDNLLHVVEILTLYILV